ncbi:MAG: hypothetical protein LBT05_13085 [Planctomycetaceae bacterium]|nr:hypothetical protein [Planctomycetaceae bacterium]
MSVVSFDIDAIVRRVMADLLPQQTTALRAPTVAPQVKSDNIKIKPDNKTENAAQLKQERNNANTKSVVRLDGQLITLAVLDERIRGEWNNVREIIVRANAVVTPSVRDLCYKKEIALTSASFPLVDKTSGSPKFKRARERSSETASVLLALHQMKREPEMLVKFLQQDAVLEKESFDCIIETVEHAIKWFEQPSNKAAILVSYGYAAAGMALVNRYANLRAIYGVTPNQIKRDATTINANVLVLPGDQLSGYQLRETARAFLTNHFHLSRSIGNASDVATPNNGVFGNVAFCPEKLLQAFNERGTR